MIPTLGLGGLGMRGAGTSSGGGGVPPSISNLYAVALYTGDGTSSKNLSGPDMTGGGLVIIKSRSAAQNASFIYSTNGASPQLVDSSAVAAAAAAATFTGTGVTLTDATFNVTGRTYVAWFFRKAARFFDVVTYAGNGSNRSLAHGLSASVALNVVKRTDTTSNFAAYHDSLGNGSRVPVFSTAAAASADATAWNSSTPTSSTFSLGTQTLVNNAAGQYVAFLFAHDTASDGVIRGVTWTGNGSASGPSVACGWQPQGVMVIPNSGSQRSIFDQTRTASFTGNDAIAFVSANNSETGVVDHLSLDASGFTLASTNALTNGNAVPYYGLVMRVP